jgi:hypothetical protein
MTTARPGGRNTTRLTTMRRTSRYGADMSANGDEARAGTALLMAAAPPGKSQLIDAAAALPALSAVPAQALTGTAAGSVVQLVDPVDPQAVQTQIRTLAQTAGPVTLYLTGQLGLDKKQSQPHIALARTTPMTMRYTALPWSWLVDALRTRPPGGTAVFVDLVADAPTWQRLSTDLLLTLGPAVELYGTVAPPPARRRAMVPAYTKALATLLRAAGTRPPLTELHRYAVQRAELPQDALLFEPATGALVLPAAPALPAGALPAGAVPAQTRERSARVRRSEAAARPADRPARVEPGAVRPVQASAPLSADPHPAILDAARAGRHTEAASMAAAWEQHALRSHGSGSPEALHWVEVRADLARLAEDPARSCELWLTAADARLRAGQAPDSADVQAAVDRAHHQWEQIPYAGVPLDRPAHPCPRPPPRRPSGAAAQGGRTQHVVGPAGPWIVRGVPGIREAGPRSVPPTARPDL